jgi:hypothetical protein
VESPEETEMFVFSTQINIKGLDCTDNHMLVWDGRQVEINQISRDVESTQTKLIHSFEQRCQLVALHRENVLVFKQHELQALNFTGAVKQSFKFPEGEGMFMNMNRNGSNLILFTSNNYFRVFNMKKRKFQQIGLSRKFEGMGGALGRISFCALNCTGDKVVIIFQDKTGQASYMPSSCFYVFDMNLDSYTKYSLSKTLSACLISRG